MAAAGDPGSGAAEQPTACPVDHKTREVWLAQARATQTGPEAAGAAAATAPSQSSPSSTSASTPSSWNWRIPFFSTASSSSSNPAIAGANQTSVNAQQQQQQLGTSRVVSSIPRSSDPGPSACPANAEHDTGADVASGNWVYPSERMFFDAMRRKGHGSAHETDMHTVVPIHNAVNERAWAEIKAWEAPYASEGKPCDGPRLHSFEGLSGQLSPRARINTWLGYTAPFDRHDWVVDRCGKRVEYIIDFYAGRPSAPSPSSLSSSSSPSPSPPVPRISFYLDVRPKLNSWEGVKMRALRGMGLS